jgi:dihydrofolate reductase
MLSYTAITSLDGYIEDAEGRFDWAMPNEDVHALANELDRMVDTHLYGRRLYETMRYWEDVPADSSAVELDYAALWLDSDKVVVSHSDADITTARTTVWPDLDPDRVRALAGHVSVGGADLAGQALTLGLVDELRLIVNPIIVGSGKPALPAGVRVNVELLEQRTFDNGVVYLRYAIDR